jgi:hypothetical protein
MYYINDSIVGSHYSECIEVSSDNLPVWFMISQLYGFFLAEMWLNHQITRNTQFLHTWWKPNILTYVNVNVSSEQSFLWKIYHTNKPYEVINYRMLIAKLKELIFIEDIL